MATVSLGMWPARYPGQSNESLPITELLCGGTFIQVLQSDARVFLVLNDLQ